MKKIFLVLGSCLLLWTAGCAKLIDIVEESTCIGNEGDIRKCAEGEDVGQLPGGNQEHCCNKRRFDNPATCIVVGSTGSSGSLDAQADVQGYFTGELGVAQNTKITGALLLNARHLANHGYQRSHCPRHDDVCLDEVIRRKWDFNGRFTLNAALRGNVDAKIKQFGVPANVQVDVAQNISLVSIGPFSLCEDQDHEDCSEQTDNASPPAITQNDGTQVAWQPRAGN
jgi:hypothetical protein